MCNVAAAGFYWDKQAARPQACPRGGRCAEGATVAAIEAAPDNYRLSDQATHFYACDTANCLGGNTSACREGSGGVLCAVCDGASHHTSVL